MHMLSMRVYQYVKEVNVDMWQCDKKFVRQVELNLLLRDSVGDKTD